MRRRHLLITLELYIMLVLANGTPVVAARILKHHWSAPVDGGRLWFDGRPLFGGSKTWRGVVSGALACALFSLATGLGMLFGLLFGVLGLAGDLLSSFIKRRLGLWLRDHEENVEQLHKNQILLDGSQQEGFLLQIFTETVIGPIFFEVIQRKGNAGFGEGNFQALFEAIEADQVARGVVRA